MKRAGKRKWVILLAAAAVLLTAYLICSRPMTMAQRYPMLTADRCTEIRGYYGVGAEAEPREFCVAQDDPEFQQLWQLFYGKEYRRALRDLLPRGTRYHRALPEDFRWEVSFCFADVPMPDGSTGSGEMLRFENWYGQLDIFFDGTQRACRTAGQEAWSAQVLELIQ